MLHNIGHTINGNEGSYRQVWSRFYYDIINSGVKQLQYNSEEELTNHKKIVEEEFNEVDAQLTALQSYHKNITLKLYKFDGRFSRLIMVQGLQ